MTNKYYGASLKNTEILKKSTSGGIAYALSEYIIKNNGVVYGVKYTSDFHGAEYSRISKLEDLTLLSGSKYITVNKIINKDKSVFKCIYEDLQNKIKVLFFGLPCDVAVLKEYLKKNSVIDNDNLITVDFVCQGPAISKVQEDYIIFLEEIYKSKVIDFSVRYKNPKWTPVYLRAQFENGKEHIKPLYETDFGRAFMILGRECCYSCSYKGNNHKADITIGDFWGLDCNEKIYNEFGTSVVVTYNEKSDLIINKLEYINIEEYQEEKALKNNPMYYKSRDRHSKLNNFKKIYESEGLHNAVYKTRSLASKIKYVIKLIIGLKPY